MAKAPHLELGPLLSTAVQTSRLPLVVTNSHESGLKDGIPFALQTVIVGHAASIAQQIAIPILAPTDATVARFDRADVALHVIVGARKSGVVITEDQMRTQIVGDLQKMGQTALLLLSEGARGLHLCQGRAPLIATLTDRGIAQRLLGGGPGTREDVFGGQHPVAHASERIDRLLPLPASPNQLREPLQLLPHRAAHRSPLFPSSCRLVSISLRAS